MLVILNDFVLQITWSMHLLDIRIVHMLPAVFCQLQSLLISVRIQRTGSSCE